eukprot:CAMPEP_0172367118 /NCGR_PEP_ID=MMETSP1060-20121228/19327_1 /TAXON_ID=37318 /ORGANISM="Pseudo-nitzschia pungens, Strain cf. cingulata" /LENGTH=355 /DNA_ID=CAMNT_0013091243 /DNA_START=256 /DNA_END=1323 /DNA_ORIENTATION=-
MATFGSPAPSAGKPRSIAPGDCLVPQAGTDGISSLNWSPTANILVSSNWDSGVRVWEVQCNAPNQIAAQPKAQVNHDAKMPVLDTCFSGDGSTVFSAGTDKAVRMWRLGETPPNNVAQQIGVHDQPVKSVGFLASSNLVVSGGWDNKLKFWDTRSPTPAGEFQLPERCYDLDVRGNLMVVATADRKLVVYDVSGQPREHSRVESPLKYQTRCVSCFPDQTGFAVGSLEGRVGIRYVQKVGNKDHFAFKCHRSGSDVYSVNCIAFQNTYGTFATVGADGVVTFWDKDNKQRLKAFNAIQQTIPCAAFNAQGNLFAYASSYDWSKGSGFYAPGSTPNEIHIHYTPDDEIKPKAAKKK